MLDRTIAPDFKQAQNISLIKPQHIKYGNGCNVFNFNSKDHELVRIEWIFGNLRFDERKPLLNLVANAMLTEGTTTRTAAQIADSIDYYGAFFQVDYGYDNCTVSLYSLNKHLQHTLPIVHDVLTNSVFPEKEITTYVKTHQQKLQVALQKNDVLARRQFNRAMYGNTIYGYAAEVADYQQLNQADLQAHFRQMYQPANCTIVVAGRVDAELTDLMSKHFDADWTSQRPSADTSQPELQPATEHFYFVERAEAIQSAIRMGRPTINRSHPDFPKVQVLNTILGGYFGSRLMANIREDKGYTYGIGSAMTSLKQSGSIFIATEVGADVCHAALKEIQFEIDRLKTELVPEEELSLVRNYMLGSLLGSLENVMSHADKFKNLYFSGLNYDYYDYYTNTIKSITSDDILKLANQYLDLDKFYKVVAGKY
ncbi:M16 family metallopeptidase [Mucilaginibacter myungsuensis]|uniref:Insulinase family protein n=1 Tax=Mucilaginibacter myungsuensis TaxID=649104 RepID=A0A929KUC7_9SPHI|nr:pitrilysin family protein [Mucilaginibacter myungsuensis]MBE9660595.1 insulinase family protein [Mucilaginibacter myungsuensis]MDN3600639.1 pitrilysin family protein [Mucilaginibacter myungsuensis]